jgi:hypothetical protein
METKTTLKINVGLWQPSILLPAPAPKCMWLSSGHVPLHDYPREEEYLSFSFLDFMEGR